MPTQSYAVTETPTDIVAALTLTVGTTYAGQFNGPSDMRAVESATAVTDTDTPALLVRPHDDVIIKPVSGEGVYVWAAAGKAGTLIVNTT